MLNLEEFRAQAHELVDWMADYFQDIRKFPVKSRSLPGEIYKQIPEDPPIAGETMEEIIKDFEKVILPGITHWQHPNFHAYFNGNSSYPSVLAEMLTATLGAQCMLWDTSPAAAELEERMMEWLRSMLDLPSNWTGVIQDGASTATLVSLLSAREIKSGWKVNNQGFDGTQRYSIYCSQQAHSSVDKAVRIAGFGLESLRKIPVDQKYAMKSDLLEAKIKQDIEEGYTPLAVIATIGTTGSTAVDPIPHIGIICKDYNIWLHIDAAWAGTALLLPEYRYMNQGFEQADSFVFNPHKWMFTNFDCSAYFVKDSKILVDTFSLVPEYLKTQAQGVNNYSEWGIQLGRRFRALKLWFVIRNFGTECLIQKVREHITWAQELATIIDQHTEFQLMVEAPLATICFRYAPKHCQDLDQMNQQLLERINQTGKLYLTHTRLNGDYVLRLVVGQTYIKKKDLTQAWEIIEETAKSS